MTFRIRPLASECPDDPEALFRDLRRRKVPGTLSHQADVIRTYMQKHLQSADVAFQLPTGSGKTLVGLLIAEWRRRRYQERVVYLCPTKQLVNQVVEQAQHKYGIDVLGFTGSKAEYTAEAKASWVNGDAVAITTYSSLFNVKPFFADPHLVVLDDAHAAEGYIASNWSLHVDASRPEHHAIFAVLTQFLRPLVSSADRSRLGDSARLHSRGWVDLIPLPVLYDHLDEFRDLLDEHTRELDLAYPWSLLRGSAEVCHLYCANNSYLLRPLIPPTWSHRPFAGAKQRVYMSATLGSGGELERLTGRRHIQRVAIPAGWDKQGIGRRFFLFPERSLDAADTNALLVTAMQQAGRCLYLVPDGAAAASVKTHLAAALHCQVFSAAQLEESKVPFVTAPHAVAVVANRYDGIDLLDDECRLLVIHGLPKGINLQERFLTSRVGAWLLLDDRISTRIVQGVGRCTRSPTDYSAVIVLGDDLQQYLGHRERRTFLHPELQSEIEFGQEQSVEASLNSLARFGPCW